MREFLRKALTRKCGCISYEPNERLVRTVERAICFETEALGVVVMKQKMPRTTTTATDSKDLFRISSLRFIFTNGLAKKSPLSNMLIGIAQIKVYLLWKKLKPL